MQAAPKKLKESYLDRLGMVLSTACAIHCAVLPFLFILLPLAGSSFLKDERLETGVILTSLLVAIFAFSRGFGWHRDFRVLRLGLFGVSCWVIGHNFLEQPWEGLAMALGGLGIASAHWLNLRLCRCCEDCGGQKP